MIRNKPNKNTRSSLDRVFQLEATAGIEPAVRVLQTLALPLGDVAIELTHRNHT
jgi:hypothetical protein